jgi:hypothetical protein
LKSFYFYAILPAVAQKNKGSCRHFNAIFVRDKMGTESRKIDKGV